MAAYYIDSNASGLNDGTSWTDAYADIATALSGKSAGDVFYVASNHSYSFAGALTYTLPASTSSNPLAFISCSTAASPPTTFTRGAAETVTGAGNDLRMTSNSGHVVFIGFDFTASDWLYITNTEGSVRCYDCTFELTSGATNDRFIFGIESSPYLENCVFKFSHAGQYIDMQAESRATLVDCSLDAATTSPDRLINLDGGGNSVTINGLDLSNASAGIDLFEPVGGDGNGSSIAVARNVKMPTSWTGAFLYASVGHSGDRYEAYNIDDGNTINQVYIDSLAGTVRTETTTVHTATYDGTNKYSLKMTCVAGGEEIIFPMWVQVAEFWAAANPDVKVNLTSDSALTDQDFWILVEGPGASSGPTSDFQDTRNANYFLGTGTTLTTGSGWTSAKTNSYEVSETAIASQAGVHRVWAFLASDAATTVYVDPFVVVT